jgi:hypothetical protein
VTLVDIGEGSATHGAGVDEVQGSGAQLRWNLLRDSAHGCNCDELRRTKDVARKVKVEVEIRCSEGAGVGARESLSTTPRHATQVVLSFLSGSERAK